MTIGVSRTVAAPPAAAWDLLTSTGTWTRWGPSVSAVDPPDAPLYAGLAGRVRTPVGIWLPFRITDVVPLHTWTWSILGLPATGHTVDSVPGGCRITFGVPPVAALYLPVCWWALRRIASELENRPWDEPPRRSG